MLGKGNSSRLRSWYCNTFAFILFFPSGKSGSKTFVAKRLLPRGVKEKEGVTVKEVNSRYFWTPLVEIDFSVGVVVPVSHAEDQLTSLKFPAGQFLFQFSIDQLKLVDSYVHL